MTAEQAAELLPLWQTMQVLSDSDTAADQEKEALITQIQETMTAEQMQAITDMNLTRQDMFAIMQEQGMAMGGGSKTATRQSGNSSNNGGRNFGPAAANVNVHPMACFQGGGPGWWRWTGSELESQIRSPPRRLLVRRRRKYYPACVDQCGDQNS